MATLFAVFALAFVALFFRRWHRSRHIALVLLAATASGCDGCSPASTPGPLRPDENTRFHVSDRLGSSALVLDREGSVIARDAHLPYGEPWVAWRDAGAADPDYAFTGKERDPTTSSVAIGVRHYIPVLGRWASPDPLFVQHPGRSIERPGERNLYRYASNDPVTHVDPNGTSVWTKLAKVGLKVAQGGSAAASFVGNVQDAQTLVNPNASTADRVLAGLSLASEVLPVSAGDVDDVLKFGRRVLGPGPAQKALSVVSESSKRQLRDRANAIHSALDPRAQRMRTTAVTQAAAPDGSITRVVSSSKRRLSPQQRATLQPGEIEGVGVGHAEVTGINAAQSKGLTAQTTAASRPICDNCASYMQSQNVTAASPLKSPK